MPGAEPERVVEHGQVEAGHRHTAALGAGVAAPYRAGEDAPEDVIVVEELEESLLEQVGEGHLSVHHGDPQLDVGLFVVSVNGQPLVGKEPGLLPGLDVVHDDVAEMPGLHLPDAGVVVPDPQVLQGPQGSRQDNTVKQKNSQTLSYLSTDIRKVSTAPFLKKFLSGSERVLIWVSLSSPVRTNWTLDSVP